MHPLEIGIKRLASENKLPHRRKKDEFYQRYMHCRQGPDAAYVIDMQHAQREGFQFYDLEHVMFSFDIVFRECTV